MEISAHPLSLLASLTTRTFVAAFGAASISWGGSCLPGFTAYQRLSDFSARIIAGEVYKSSAFLARDEQLENDSTLSRRSSSMSNLTIVRLRKAELALAAGDQVRVGPALDSLQSSIENALENAPNDAFLWLVLFWVENARNGFDSKNFRFLRMSYASGPYEGWIAVRRNRFALALYRLLPAELATAAISEFAGLFQSQYYIQAADIVAGPGSPIRNILLARLRDLQLKNDEVRYFDRLLNERKVDDTLRPDGQSPERPWR